LKTAFLPRVPCWVSCLGKQEIFCSHLIDPSKKL
jgi:hypothetical protein